MSIYTTIKALLAEKPLHLEDFEGARYESGQVQIIGEYSLFLADDLRSVEGANLHRIRLTVSNLDEDGEKDVRTIVLTPEEVDVLRSVLSEVAVEEEVSA